MDVDPDTLSDESTIIISVLHEDGPLNTQQLRERTGIDNRTLNNRYFDTLRPKRLVTKNGTESVSGGKTAKVLELTSEGHSIYHALPSISELTQAEMLRDDVRDALRKRDRRIEELHNRCDSLTDRIEDLERINRALEQLAR